MRCLEKNKVPFWYALYTGKIPLVIDGLETGEYVKSYTTPVMVEANIAVTAGKTNIEPWGDWHDYDMIITCDRDEFPIDENSVIGIGIEPTYEHGSLKYNYIVRRVAPLLNSCIIAISKVDVQ